MKRYALVFIVFTFAFLKPSIAQKLAFSYDASGNQTERSWICINCPSASQMAMDKKTTTGLERATMDEGLITGRGIKTYPNPLKETLNVTWGVPDKIFLKRIEIYSVGGNTVFKTSLRPEERQTTISFQQLPPGTYLLIAHYSDARTDVVQSYYRIDGNSLSISVDANDGPGTVYARVR